MSHELPGVTITRAYIQVSKSGDPRGFVPLLHLSGKFPRCKRPKIITWSVGGSEVWLRSLFDDHGETHVPLRDFVRFLKVVPVVADQHAPVALTDLVVSEARSDVEGGFAAHLTPEDVAALAAPVTAPPPVAAEPKSNPTVLYVSTLAPSTLKCRRVLYEHRGQNAGSAKDPVCEYTEGCADLTLDQTVCRSDDDDGLTTVKRYAVCDVWLPDWLSTASWVRDHIKWHWAWAYGGDPTWPRAWQEWFAFGLDSYPHKLEAIRLLKTKAFRSPFRADLRNRIAMWLDADPSQRVYQDSPLSRRQWEAVVNHHPVHEADRLDERIYWDAQYHEMRGAPVTGLAASTFT